jgi:hypothetical protein
MTTKELKKKVIVKINQSNDDEILTEVYKMLDTTFEDSEIYHLSENHKLAIKMGINQVNSGEYLTNEQANKEAAQWLNK